MDDVRRLQNIYYNHEVTSRDQEQHGRDAPPSDPIGDMASSSGIIRSLPLLRVEWAVLPGYRNMLRVEQAQYTHMFEKIMGGPRPWLFGHLKLPGGSANLGRPEYGLERGTQAALVGTVMEVTDCKRLDDGRILLLVHALDRMVVSEPKQITPYSIADVQLYPDMEQTAAYEEAASTALKDLSLYCYYYSSVGTSVAPFQGDMDRWKHAVAHAATVEEGKAWRPFEFSRTTFDTNMAGVTQQSFQLVPFNASATTHEPSKQMMRQVMTDLSHPEDNVDRLDVGGRDMVQTWEELEHLGIVHAEQLKQTSGSVKVDTEEIVKLEYEIWRQIDSLLRLLNELQPNPPPDRNAENEKDGDSFFRGLKLPGRVPAPQLLGLLPRPPPGGWPLGFYFDTAGEQIMGTKAGRDYFAVGTYDAYPVLRRAQRLSYYACAIFGTYRDGRLEPLQPVLEIPTVYGRLTWVYDQLRGTNHKLRSQVKR